eukprot:snap_masked-scaffold_4-processed-gene-21.74-mRNA-1 protein AED:1.00 eAED:1.00 QI:0/0/0/0/1/1/2/0/96
MKLLYLPSVPTQKELDSKRESTAVGMVPMGGSVRKAVASQTWKVLTGKDLIKSLSNATRYGNIQQIPIKVVLGIFEWFFNVLVFLFPATTVSVVDV